MRLQLLAHGETERTRDSVFGDRSPLHPDRRIDPMSRPTECFCGPEPACRSTAAAIGRQEAVVLDELAGPDFGLWSGRALADVLEHEPQAVGRWLTDPDAVPHQGESLAAMSERVGLALDRRPWPDAGAVLVVSPWVARAALVHALAAGPAALLRTDVAPLGLVQISRHRSSWRLVALEHPRRPSD